MQTGCIDENYFEPYDIRVNMSFAEWLKLAESRPSASKLILRLSDVKKTLATDFW